MVVVKILVGLNCICMWICKSVSSRSPAILPGSNLTLEQYLQSYTQLESGVVILLSCAPL